ncbi:hypothetical protein ILUMI_13746 [Ignelater luminosus]|uniref:Ankyrin repeat protein n=1 Tax=Ignelater luminosus TaxID=2038154 RepID=A0A8K0G5I1_IGNLU|nr:hypothetical protein ILUMI_13746 [Ignelater luminosus]
MSQKSQLKYDTTTSTNYGPPFEISTTAIFVLRCLEQKKDFTVWINYMQYSPWDDIVANVDENTLCVQLKHSEKLDTNRLSKYLEQREETLKHVDGKPTIFVYFATTSDNYIRSKYSVAETYPEILNLLLTNRDCVYFDNRYEKGNTYFCMRQDTVLNETTNIKEALLNYIGKEYVPGEHLNEIQIKFLDYIRKRYHRFLKGIQPINNREVRTHLAYAMLNKYKIQYKLSDTHIQITNNIEEILDNSSIVVFNHKRSSAFKKHIWSHLMPYLEKNVLKIQLEWLSLDELWRKGKIHMPLFSPNTHCDKVILRALEIADFKPKVIILRPRLFNIKNGQEIMTILQNLDMDNPKILPIKTGENLENFKVANVDFAEIMHNRELELHEDSFTEISRKYFSDPFKCTFKNFIEAHDEFNYVNDSNKHGDKLPAIYAAIKIKDIALSKIQKLIDLGSDINTNPIHGGLLPIFYAIEENRPDIVELLLKNKANIELSDVNGMRPLFYACIENKIEMAKLLIEYGADRSAADRFGFQSIFMAYNNGNYEIMKLILKDYKKATEASSSGSHILHKIAEDGNTKALQCVLECCPDVRIFMTRNAEDKTPFDIAIIKSDEKFVKLLSDALKIVQ